uniref:Uncharacterized protein n=1 Tax=viral metagenome TaxID=1070528 RepID=A0A6C0JE78_9ZZZZ
MEDFKNTIHDFDVLFDQFEKSKLNNTYQTDDSMLYGKDIRLKEAEGFLNPKNNFNAVSILHLQEKTDKLSAEMTSIKKELNELRGLVHKIMVLLLR